MLFRAWNVLGVLYNRKASSTLQWGHALSSMECSAVKVQRRESVPLQWGHALSSMEWLVFGELLLVADLLQWGHALSSMECATSLACASVSYPLQWGHALSSMEWKSTLPYNRPGASFNGAMLFRAWNGTKFGPRRIQSSASMGPCSFEHGMSDCVFVHVHHQQLQWGHALSSMECS